MLRTIRTSHGKGRSAIVSPRHGRTTLEAWAEEQGLYSVLDRYKEIKKITGNNEFTNGILMEVLTINQWTFIDDIKQILTYLKDMDTIKPLYIDILHNLSSQHNAGIMNFPIFVEQLYKINYRGLFLQPNFLNIKLLMKLFNAKHHIDYYTTAIYKYNAANIELTNRIEHELFLVLDKLIKDNK